VWSHLSLGTIVAISFLKLGQSLSTEREAREKSAHRLFALNAFKQMAFFSTILG